MIDSAFKLNQVGLVHSHTVAVVVHGICFRTDTGVITQLTVCTKQVILCCEAVCIGCTDPGSFIGNRHAAAADTVVITIDLNQTGIVFAHTVLIVVQGTAFVDNFLGHNDSAFCIKAVSTRRQQSVVLADPAGLAGLQLAASTGKVVVTILLHQTGCGLDAIHIVVAIVYTLIDDHLAIGTEVIVTLGNETIGCLGADPDSLVGGYLGKLTNVIDSAFKLN